MDATDEIGKVLKLVAEAWAVCHDPEQAGKLSEASDVLRFVLPKVRAQADLLVLGREWREVVVEETNALARAAGLEEDMPVAETLRKVAQALRVQAEWAEKVQAEVNRLAGIAGLSEDVPVLETLSEIGAVLAKGRQVPVLMALREAD